MIKRANTSFFFAFLGDDIKTKTSFHATKKDRSPRLFARTMSTVRLRGRTGSAGSIEALQQ